MVLGAWVSPAEVIGGFQSLTVPGHGPGQILKQPKLRLLGGDPWKDPDLLAVFCWCPYLYVWFVLGW